MSSRFGSADGFDVALALINAEVPKFEEGLSLEDRLRVAMGKALNHWMITNEDLQFRAAVGVVAARSTEQEEKDRLFEEIKALRAFGALLAGVPVDVERMAEQTKDLKLVGLAKLWAEVKAA